MTLVWVHRRKWCARDRVGFRYRESRTSYRRHTHNRTCRSGNAHLVSWGLGRGIVHEITRTTRFLVLISGVWATNTHAVLFPHFQTSQEASHARRRTSPGLLSPDRTSTAAGRCHCVMRWDFRLDVHQTCGTHLADL